MSIQGHEKEGDECMLGSNSLSTTDSPKILFNIYMSRHDYASVEEFLGQFNFNQWINAQTNIRVFTQRSTIQKIFFQIQCSFIQDIPDGYISPTEITSVSECIMSRVDMDRVMFRMYSSILHQFKRLFEISKKIGPWVNGPFQEKWIQHPLFELMCHFPSDKLHEQNTLEFLSPVLDSFLSSELGKSEVNKVQSFNTEDSYSSNQIEEASRICLLEKTIMTPSHIFGLPPTTTLEGGQDIVCSPFDDDLSHIGCPANILVNNPDTEKTQTALLVCMRNGFWSKEPLFETDWMNTMKRELVWDQHTLPTLPKETTENRGYNQSTSLAQRITELEEEISFLTEDRAYSPPRNVIEQLYGDKFGEDKEKEGEKRTRKRSLRSVDIHPVPRTLKQFPGFMDKVYMISDTNNDPIIVRPRTTSGGTLFITRSSSIPEVLYSVYCTMPYKKSIVLSDEYSSLVDSVDLRDYDLVIVDEEFLQRVFVDSLSRIVTNIAKLFGSSQRFPLDMYSLGDSEESQIFYNRIGMVYFYKTDHWGDRARRLEQFLLVHSQCKSNLFVLSLFNEYKYLIPIHPLIKVFKEIQQQHLDISVQCNVPSEPICFESLCSMFKRDVDIQIVSKNSKDMMMYNWVVPENIQRPREFQPQEIEGYKTIPKWMFVQDPLTHPVFRMGWFRVIANDLSTVTKKFSLPTLVRRHTLFIDSSFMSEPLSPQFFVSNLMPEEYGRAINSQACKLAQYFMLTGRPYHVQKKFVSIPLDFEKLSGPLFIPNNAYSLLVRSSIYSKLEISHLIRYFAQLEDCINPINTNYNIVDHICAAFHISTTKALNILKFYLMEHEYFLKDDIPLLKDPRIFSDLQKHYIQNHPNRDSFFPIQPPSDLHVDREDYRCMFCHSTPNITFDPCGHAACKLCLIEWKSHDHSSSSLCAMCKQKINWVVDKKKEGKEEREEEKEEKKVSSGYPVHPKIQWWNSFLSGIKQKLNQHLPGCKFRCCVLIAYEAHGRSTNQMVSEMIKCSSREFPRCKQFSLQSGFSIKERYNVLQELHNMPTTNSNELEIRFLFAEYDTISHGFPLQSVTHAVFANVHRVFVERVVKRLGKYVTPKVLVRKEGLELAKLGEIVDLPNVNKSWEHIFNRGNSEQYVSQWMRKFQGSIDPPQYICSTPFFLYNVEQEEEQKE